MTRDLIFLIIGAGIVIKQGFFVPKGDFNLWLTLFGGAIAQVPVAGHLIPLLRGAGSPSADQPPSEPSQPESSLPSA